jgi:plastocyanin
LSLRPPAWIGRSAVGSPPGDKSNIHNFHLTGPGVNKLTSTPWVGTKTWTVKLKKGIYRFVCDPHATIMKGVLRVT